MSEIGNLVISWIMCGITFGSIIMYGALGEILTENSLEQDVSEMPFVICKIGEDLQGAEYEDIVRKQMQMAAASNVNVRIVETTGFILPDENDNNDRWHFAGKDIIEIGKRFASVVNQMNGKTEEV